MSAAPLTDQDPSLPRSRRRVRLLLGASFVTWIGLSLLILANTDFLTDGAAPASSAVASTLALTALPGTCLYMWVMWRLPPRGAPTKVATSLVALLVLYLSSRHIDSGACRLDGLCPTAILYAALLEPPLFFFVMFLGSKQRAKSDVSSK